MAASALGGSCAIHQYTSNGRLDGFNAPLDLDIAYMTREAWGKFANTSGSAAPTFRPQRSPSLRRMARRLTLQQRSCAASMALMMSAAKSSATVTKRCKTSSTILTALPLLSSQTMWNAECSALCRRAAMFWATASARFRQSSTKGWRWRCARLHRQERRHAQRDWRFARYRLAHHRKQERHRGTLYDLPRPEAFLLVFNRGTLTRGAPLFWR